MEQQFHATGAAAVGSERTGTHAIDRAAQLLVLVLTAERPPALGELAQGAEQAKSPAAGLLEALDRHGLAAQDGARARFSVVPVLLRFDQRRLLDRLLPQL